MTLDLLASVLPPVKWAVAQRGMLCGLEIRGEVGRGSLSCLRSGFVNLCLTAMSVRQSKLSFVCSFLICSVPQRSYWADLSNGLAKPELYLPYHWRLLEAQVSAVLLAVILLLHIPTPSCGRHAECCQAVVGPNPLL